MYESFSIHLFVFDLLTYQHEHLFSNLFMIRFITSTSAPGSCKKGHIFSTTVLLEILAIWGKSAVKRTKCFVLIKARCKKLLLLQRKNQFFCPKLSKYRPLSNVLYSKQFVDLYQSKKQNICMYSVFYHVRLHAQYFQAQN